MFVTFFNKIKKLKDNSLKFWKINLFNFLNANWLENFISNQMYVFKEFLKKLQYFSIKINISWFNIDFFFRLFVGFTKVCLFISIIILMYL